MIKKTESKKVENTLYCADCKKELPLTYLSSGASHLPCPDCGSVKQLLKMHLHDDVGAEINDTMKLKAKQKGIKKPVQEIISGADQRKSKGDWVDKHRLIDRENDRYIETVRDKKTGEIIHHTDEPLTEHWGHGSAKAKSPPLEGEKDD